MRLFDQAKYSFIEKRGGAYVFSVAPILLGIAAMVFNVFNIGSWQNYGVDFTGGSMIQVEFHEPPLLVSRELICPFSGFLADEHR
mgnify:CR=1 FL=1